MKNNIVIFNIFYENNINDISLFKLFLFRDRRERQITMASISVTVINRDRFFSSLLYGSPSLF